jgi:RNA polymerase sigma-70 factor (ECF subfamily)
MQGDRAALGDLLEQHRHRFFNVAFRMVGHREEAAEVTQDAMLKIIEGIGTFQGQAALTTWMIRIVMNTAISHLRKRRLRQTVSLDAPGAANAGRAGGIQEQLADHREPAPDQSVQNQEMIRCLQDAISRLDTDFHSVLVLRDIDQMDYQQISEVLDIPVGTVKSRLFRARLSLRHQMLEQSGAPPIPAAPRKGIG